MVQSQPNALIYAETAVPFLQSTNVSVVLVSSTQSTNNNGGPSVHQQYQYSLEGTLVKSIPHRAVSFSLKFSMQLQEEQMPQTLLRVFRKWIGTSKLSKT